MKKQKGFLSPTLILVLVLVAVAAALYGGFRYLIHDNQELTEDKAKQEVVISVQADTIDKDTKSAVVTEKVTTEVVVESKKVVDTHQRVTAKTEAKVEQINAQAAAAETAAPTTQDKEVIETARIEKVSAARIDGLWEKYCSAAAEAQGCKATP